MCLLYARGNIEYFITWCALSIINKLSFRALSLQILVLLHTDFEFCYFQKPEKFPKNIKLCMITRAVVQIYSL